METDTRYIIGCMTGTSIDGLDAAVVRIDGCGIAMRASLLMHQGTELGSCREPLRALASQTPMTAGQIAQLAHDFSMLHAKACKKLWQAASQLTPLPQHPSLISVHGQTVWHRPPVSWQLFQPTPLAHLMQCRVVCDLRQSDLAAGGQGAPLTPIADYVLFADPHRTLTVVNFGGFCNLTHLPRRGTQGSAEQVAAQIKGGDLCACNHLLDEISRRGFGCPFDHDGVQALAGRPIAPLADELLQLLVASGSDRRSLGTGDECQEWVLKALKTHGPRDVAATASEVLGAVVAHAVPPESHVMCLGGGARHGRLMEALARQLGKDRIAMPSMPVDAREAACWAVLGALAEDGVEVGVPGITRRVESPRIAGLWVS
ncbi:MAG: anhydro-N-acetylmuramic acid kinase [Planctomycetota bacterium]|nr:anhydro-N-acetylmuramic acid kinase [Planctomycetota bacterium]